MDKFSQTNKSMFRKIQKILIGLLCIFNTPGDVLMAQSSSSIRLSVEVIPAQCQSDGCIICTLSDTAGQHLEQIRYYYTPLSGCDSIISTTLSTITHLRPDTYKVKVTAIKPTGLSQEQANIIVSDSVVVVVEETDYTIPEVGVVYHNFTFENPCGIVPSMTCLPTGKVQICIRKGAFPYTVSVWKIEGVDTLPYKTIVFDSSENIGTDIRKYDYQHYYTIDSLWAGNYFIQCHDRCEYYTIPISINVPEIIHNLQDKYHLIGNCADIYGSYNIIRFKELFHNKFVNKDSSNDDYYHYIGRNESIYEYRFINPTFFGGNDTTDWYPMPVPDNHNKTSVYYYDTLKFIHNYGELWGENIQLQLRPRLCKDKLLTFTYLIRTPYKPKVSCYQHAFNSFLTPSYMDHCGRHTGSSRTEHHQTFLDMYFEQYYCESLENDKTLNCRMPYASSDTSNSHTYFYYTLPMHYRIYNLSADTIITLMTITEHKINKICSWSSRFLIDTTLSGSTLLVEIYDDLDCPYYSQTFDIGNIGYKTKYFPDIFYKTQWNAKRQNISDFCTDTKRGIILSQYEGAMKFPIGADSTGNTLTGDTIRLISSPRGDLYNFTAVYRGDCQWDVIEQDLANTATFRNLPSTYCPSVIYEDIDLPSGLYIWEIYSHCEKKWYTINFNAEFVYKPDVMEKPAYKFTPHCLGMEIIPVAGQFSRDGLPIETKFQVCNGEFRHQPSQIYDLYDTIKINVPGTYTISMYTLPKNDTFLLTKNPCFRIDTVIEVGNSTILFDYLHAYVCSRNDSTGFIRVKGKNGLMPYTYTLYDAPNGSGTIIAQNQTGEFDSVPIHFNQKMSIEMCDNCGAHFFTNFTVSNMEHTRKGWVEDNLENINICEGVICHFYGLSLGNVTYHWTGPNGFYEKTKNPTLFLQRNSALSGTYYINIEGSGCSTMCDSIKINVLKAPGVYISGDTTVCPGQEIKITSKTYGTGNVSYKMLCQSYLGNDTICFPPQPAGTCNITKDTVMSDKTRYSIIEILDEKCHYKIPDDTLQVNLLKSTYLNDVITVNDTVCKGETAVLQASPVDTVSHQLIWYRDFNMQHLARIDTFTGTHKTTYYNFPNIQTDTTLFASSTQTGGCPYFSNSINDKVNMHNGSRFIKPGENILFYDSGGPDTCYEKEENYKLSFHSTDSLIPLQIRFFYFVGNDSLQQDSIDRLYLFDSSATGSSADLILRGRHQDGESITFTAKSGHLTCWFISRHTDIEHGDQRAYSGWRAIVSATHKAQPASVILKPSLGADIVAKQTETVDTLYAIADDESHNYHYQWEKSFDGITWTCCDDTGKVFILDKLNVDARYYRVRIADRKVDICDGLSAPYRPKLPPVNLRIDYRFMTDSICPEDQNAFITINNDGNMPASYIQLVQRIQYSDSIRQDTACVIKLAGHDSVTVACALPASPRDTSYSILLKAQITDCLQYNDPDSVVFNNWDWKGNPRQQDECQKIIIIKNYPRDTIVVSRYEGHTFSYRDSTSAPLKIGEQILQWLFKNTFGCDSLIITKINVLPLPPCPSVNDYDGHTYTSVRIKPLCWMQQNLRSRFYDDGRPVPNPMVYYAHMYPDVVKNEAIFGLLYTWRAAIDTARKVIFEGRRQGICPTGWYLPTASDYDQLLQYGIPALRSAQYWIGGSGNNSTGFNALPAGFYNSITRKFEHLLGETRFWSTAPDPNLNLFYQTIMVYYCSEGQIFNNNGEDGCSVRCVWREQNP